MVSFELFSFFVYICRKALEKLKQRKKTTIKQAKVYVEAKQAIIKAPIITPKALNTFHEVADKNAIVWKKKRTEAK